MTRSGFTLFMTALVLHGIGAQASSLDKDVCDKLKEEQVQLEQAGLRATMAKGPEWGRNNLAPDKLLQVRRLIELDEQLLFRCQGKPLVLLPSSVDADPVAPADASPDGEKDAAGNVIPGKAAPAKDAKAETKAPAAKKAAAVKPPAGETKADAPAKKAVAIPKAPPATKGPAPAEAKQPKDAAPEAVKVAKPKPAPPKKKVDDAYKPPQTDPGQNPFGLQDPAKQ